jgi:hypothetical protein
MPERVDDLSRQIYIEEWLIPNRKLKERGEGMERSK